MCAEKLRAVSQRARYRDFYDLYFLIERLKIDYKKALDVLTKKEIRSPVIAGNIAKNWSIAEEQKEGDLGGIYCSEEIANKDRARLIASELFGEEIPSDLVETPEIVEENIASDFILTSEEALAGETEEEKAREVARQRAIKAGQVGFIDPTTGKFVKI